MAFVSLQNGLSVQVSKGCSEGGVLFVQGLTTKIPFEDLMAMTKFALTSAPLTEGDPRLSFVEDVRRLQFVSDETGKRFELSENR